MSMIIDKHYYYELTKELEPIESGTSLHVHGEIYKVGNEKISLFWNISSKSLAPDEVEVDPWVEPILEFINLKKNNGRLFLPLIQRSWRKTIFNVNIYVNMKYLKIYEEFVYDDTKVNFIKPAFEIKEFWRIFKKFPESAKKLGFDLQLFKEEPEIFERHEDPVFDDKLSTEDLKKKVDKKYIPFIDKCDELLNIGKLIRFDTSKLQKIATDSNTIGRGDFSEFLKEKDFLEDRKKAYEETMQILKKNNETNIYASGLISKYPELKGFLQKAQSYLYYKDSWDKFDEKIEKGDSIQASSILVIGGKYIILGGNRRMAYYIVSKINPMIWVINLQ